MGKPLYQEKEYNENLSPLINFALGRSYLQACYEPVREMSMRTNDVKTVQTLGLKLNPNVKRKASTHGNK